ncbi:uncharacterized protein LOC111053687 [Nilaparvata lugens]|uniref:uncharacterized protein LOC111053687 n=1 Tax=Nilaparvata lugens TaxID=108931 RepID=UPI00193CC120|nr:uncharacterized protein LOC111053687 [Nilaparvata lugens]
MEEQQAGQVHGQIQDRKMMNVMLNPYFLVPQLIVLGFAPIILANLKMLVMKALMMNQMALSAAVFMTIRNMVFGPSTGPEIKYVNYGYPPAPNSRHKRATSNRPR